MSPYLTLRNHRDQWTCYLEGIRYFDESTPIRCGKLFDYAGNVIFGKFCAPILCSLFSIWVLPVERFCCVRTSIKRRSIRAPFAGAISHVLRTGRRKEMNRIHARRIITFVSDITAPWISAIVDEPRDPTGAIHFPASVATKRDAPIAASSTPSGPRPARFSFSNVYAIPKSSEFSLCECGNWLKLLLSHLASFTGDVVRAARSDFHAARLFYCTTFLPLGARI